MIEAIAILTFICGLALLIRGRWYIAQADTRFHQTVDVAQQNQRVVAYNKTILKKVELSAFEAKEAGIFLFDHYEAMLQILDNCDEESAESLDEAARITHDALETVSTAFTHTFGVTPQQWKTQKNKVQLHNTSTGKSYPSDMLGIN